MACIEAWSEICALKKWRLLTHCAVRDPSRGEAQPSGQALTVAYPSIEEDGCKAVSNQAAAVVRLMRIRATHHL